MIQALLQITIQFSQLTESSAVVQPQYIHYVLINEHDCENFTGLTRKHNYIQQLTDISTASDLQISP